MTSNQISWQNYLQTVRRDEETARHNLSDESIRTSANRENVRHNKISEKQNLKSLFESKRHNKRFEKETKRHNKMVEKETTRHNIATEGLTAFDNQTRREGVSVNRISANAQALSAKANWRNAITSAKRQRVDQRQGLRNVKSNERQADAAQKNAESRASEAATKKAELYWKQEFKKIDKELKQKDQALEELKLKINQSYNDGRLGVDVFRALIGIIDFG